MMSIKYKQKCFRCKENFVIVSRRQKYVMCYDCQKDALQKEIADPEMNKLFDIPEIFYKTDFFLRNVKLYYLKYGRISENQKTQFIQLVDELKKSLKKEK
jgi:hypothetical protein